MEPKYYNDSICNDILDVKCIFIESSSSLAEDISEEYYLDEGIPSSYEQQTSEKPAYAKVFRYHKVEYIDKPMR